MTCGLNMDGDRERQFWTLDKSVDLNTKVIPKMICILTDSIKQTGYDHINLYPLCESPGQMQIHLKKTVVRSFG